MVTRARRHPRQIPPAARALERGRRTHMRPTLVAASLAALACLTPTPGAAGATATRSGPYRLEVLDEAGGALPAFFHRGQSEEHTSELQSPVQLVCRVLLEQTK